MIVDVLGWFPDTGGFESLVPARLADTRPGFTSVDGVLAGGGAVGAGGTLRVPVLGRGGVPSSGVGAVAVNVTVTGSTAGGYLTVFPTGTNRPLASNLNFAAGDTIPNMAIAKLGADGSISIYNLTGSVHVIVDVLGWFSLAANPELMGDIEPPQLQSLSWTPSSVNTSTGAQTITVTARITDDFAGNAGYGYSSSPSQMRFRSPSGNQMVNAMLDDGQRISGTALDGTVRYSMIVPAFAESGVWTVEYFMLVDQVGNTRDLTRSQLAASGFQTTFISN